MTNNIEFERTENAAKLKSHDILKKKLESQEEENSTMVLFALFYLELLHYLRWTNLWRKQTGYECFKKKIESLRNQVPTVV